MSSLFESGEDYVSVPCEKLRRKQGPKFNMNVVKSLFNLRTDWVDNKAKKQATLICKEIVEKFDDAAINKLA